MSQDTDLLSPSLLTLPVGDSKLQCKVSTFPPNAPLRMYLGHVLKSIDYSISCTSFLRGLILTTSKTKRTA